MKTVRLKLPRDVLDRYRAWAKYLGKPVSELMRNHLRQITPAPKAQGQGNRHGTTRRQLGVRMRQAIAVLLLFTACTLAQDAPPAIVFPTGPVVPVPPQPPLPPNTPVKLSPDTIYVVRSDKPCLLLASPKGVVKITLETGPMRVRGVWVDGDGKQETRTLTEKYLWFVEPQETGTCEVIAIPPGATTEKEVVRRLVESSTGPRPPPIPPIPPDPSPSPAPIPLPGFRVLIVYETADLGKYPPGQLAVIQGKVVRDYLEAKCVVGKDGKTKEYRIFDKDVVATGDAKQWQDALARPRTALPWMVISDGKQGWEGPMPGSVEEAMRIMKKIGGEQ